MPNPVRKQLELDSALLVYVILLLSLQIFLITVAVEGFLEGDAVLAWSATAISGVLAGSVLLFYRYLR